MDVASIALVLLLTAITVGLIHYLEHLRSGRP